MNTRKNQNRKNQPVVRLIPINIEEYEEKSETTDPSNQDIVTSSSNDEDANDCVVTIVSDANGDDDSNSKPEATAVNKFQPHFSVPEKIIIILDRARDDECTNFDNNKKQLAPLLGLKYGLRFFLHLKSGMNKSNEFALMVLNESNATWVQDFTRDTQTILNSLEKVDECEAEDRFDMNTVFNLIEKHATICPKEENGLPAYVTRVILLYSRSYTMPKLEKTEVVQTILNSPYFTLDVCMSHEPPSTSNHAAKIFQTLQKIDTKELAHAYSVHRNAKTLHESLAKLLAHPLQRPHQHDANYTIKVV